MSDTHNPESATRQAEIYQLRIRGHLGPHWAGWFEGMTVTPEGNGESIVTGPVVDQAALHGLLKQVRDLGLPLLSVIRVEPAETGAPGSGDTRHGMEGDHPE